MTEPNVLENIPIEKERQVETLGDFLKTGESGKLEFATFDVPVEMIFLAENIRPFDEKFIDTLAWSIIEIGQRQPGTGDVVLIEGSPPIRCVAGQHRYKATVKAKEWGYDKRYKINLANRELNPYEILKIQMAENLQNKMTSAQEAQVINGLWQMMKALRDCEGEKLSVTEFARSASRSPDTVRDAIKYVEGVSPIVQKLVDEKILPYTVSLLLTEVPNIIRGRDRGKGPILEDIYREQLCLAQKFVTMNFTFDKAKKYIEQLKQENNFAGPLFGDDWQKMEVVSHMIAIRDESDKKGREATGWFVKIVRMVQLLPDTSKAEFSEAIQKAMSELGMSRDQFEEKLKPLVTEKQLIGLFGKRDVFSKI